MEFLSNIKIRLSLLLTVSITLCSCCSLRVWDFEYVECKEIPKEAVNIAIKDYSKRLHRQKDTNITAVQVMVNYTSTDWFYLAMLPLIDEANKFNRDYLISNLGKVPNKYTPTEYVEVDGVLYVWHNPQMVLTEDFIEKLTHYNLVLGEDEVWILSTGGTYTSYIFCKYNYKKKYYRRVVSHYITRLPMCGCH